ncbi:MAG: bifunctional lytic transglycosylase/C40 family peptidase [Sporichthyaceae bacterium]
MSKTWGLAAGAGFFAFTLALPLAVTVLGSGESAAASELNSARVPAQWTALVAQAGIRCPQLGITAPLLAAQLDAESAWNPAATSSVGAQGLAQFMPGTWALWGADAGGDGVSSPVDPADAIDAQARFMCHLAQWATQKLTLGVIAGDPVQLALAAYNAGAGAVSAYGGIPPYPETRGYLTRIRELVPTYTVAPELIGALPASSSAIVAQAAQWVGQPYVWGGGDLAGPTSGLTGGAAGWDCSGLVRYALWHAARVDLGRPADAQARDRRGVNVPRDLAFMRPGDVIAFSDSGGANFQHIGIYAGNGQMIHAPRTGIQVEITDLRTDTYFASMVWAIKRYTGPAPTPKTAGKAKKAGAESETGDKAEGKKPTDRKGP